MRITPEGMTFDGMDGLDALNAMGAGGKWLAGRLRHAANRGAHEAVQGARTGYITDEAAAERHIHTRVAAAEQHIRARLEKRLAMLPGLVESEAKDALVRIRPQLTAAFAQRTARAPKFAGLGATMVMRPEAQPEGDVF